MSIKGFNINGQVQKYDYTALDNLPQDSGLSEQAKQALLACFQNVAWINADGQTYYDALEAALQTAETYTVTNVLTGCTTSNSASIVYEGRSYTATITADSGYTLEGATATATMGGQTVTGFYNNGQISIPNVTGDLVITVTASSAISSLSAVFTQGQNVIFDVNPLSVLEQYLTVTATYSDSTTEVVTDYTLSGELTAGTSTITVSYGGKTTTFDVIVTELDSLPESVMIDGYHASNNTNTNGGGPFCLYYNSVYTYDHTKYVSAIKLKTATTGQITLGIYPLNQISSNKANSWDYVIKKATAFVNAVGEQTLNFDTPFIVPEGYVITVGASYDDVAKAEWKWGSYGTQQGFCWVGSNTNKSLGVTVYCRG